MHSWRSLRAKLASKSPSRKNSLTPSLAEFSPLNSGVALSRQWPSPVDVMKPPFGPYSAMQRREQPERLAHLSIGLAAEIRNDEDGLVASASLLTPEGEEDAHGAAVDMCRQLLDSCPEVDIAEVSTMDATGARASAYGHDLAYKRIPRANLPRWSETRPHRHFFEVMRRQSAADSWTQRLRAQGELARLSVKLLDDVPARLLSPVDNQRRRREWEERTENFRELSAALPGAPTHTSSDLALGSTHEQPPAPRDSVKALYDTLSTALTQLAQELSSMGSDRFGALAGQMFSASELATDISNEDRPKLSSVGTTHPVALTESLATVAVLLLALHRGLIAVRRGRKNRDGTWLDAARELEDRIRLETTESERTAIESWLSSHSVSAQVLVSKPQRRGEDDLDTRRMADLG